MSMTTVPTTADEIGSTEIQVMDGEVAKELYEKAELTTPIKEGVAEIPSEKQPSEEQPVAVTGIQFMNAVKVEDLMTEIEKNKPIRTGSFKKVYKLNDKEVISVEVNMKRKNRGEKKTETEFTEEEKEEYETIMKKMHALNPEHKKYLLLPTEYGYVPPKSRSRYNPLYMLKKKPSSTTRVQILPYCNQNDGKCLDLYNLLEGKCTYDDQNSKIMMTDCVNILKTIRELHKKNIVCMDIKLENTFVNCPGKAYLSLGDTDGFKIWDPNGVKDNCAFTPGYYVKPGHFITDYFAWLQVFLLVYLSVHKGLNAALRLISPSDGEEYFDFDKQIIDLFENIGTDRNLFRAYQNRITNLLGEQNTPGILLKIPKILFRKRAKDERSGIFDEWPGLREILEALKECINFDFDLVDKPNWRYREKTFYNHYITPLIDAIMPLIDAYVLPVKEGGRKSKKSSRRKKMKSRGKKR